MESWSPRRNCRKAAVRRPPIVTGTRPRMMPEIRGSTIEVKVQKRIPPKREEE
jgi:hypothetical protein